MKSKNVRQMKQPALGKRIQELRKNQGLTQEELVDLCNISVRTIQRIEAGDVTPRSHTIKTILQALGESLNSIMEEDDKITDLNVNSRNNYLKYINLGWIFGIIYFIIGFIESGLDYYWLQDDHFFIGNTFYIGVKSISLISSTLLMFGLLTLGSLYQNYIIRIAAMIMLIANIIATGYDMSSLFINNIDITYSLGAKAVVFGVLGIILGIGLLKLKSLGMIAKISGIFEIITGMLFATVILSVLGIFFLIPTILFEIILLYKVAEKLRA